MLQPALLLKRFAGWEVWEEILRGTQVIPAYQASFQTILFLMTMFTRKFTFSSKNDKSQIFTEKMLIFVHFYRLIKMSPTFRTFL